MNMERKVFEAEQRSIDNISKLIDERVAQLRTQIEGSKTRLDSTLKQIEIIDEELSGVQQLYDKGPGTQTPPSVVAASKRTIAWCRGTT